MKSVLSTFAKVSAAVCLAAAAVGASALELRGFRGVAWGEGAQALGQDVVAHSTGHVTCYQREGENMMFGDTALQGVRYCFHQDRLFMVTLDAAADTKTVAAEIARTYGRPDSRQGKLVSWGGKASGTRVELVPNGQSAARLTIYTDKIEPGLAKRMQAQGLPEMVRQIAAAF